MPRRSKQVGNKKSPGSVVPNHPRIETVLVSLEDYPVPPSASHRRTGAAASDDVNREIASEGRPLVDVYK